MMTLWITWICKKFSVKYSLLGALIINIISCVIITITSDYIIMCIGRFF